MLPQHALERHRDLPQGGRVEAIGGVDRREAGREQQDIALAKRHIERLGEVEHHLPARPAAAALDEADVPLRHAGVQGEVELRLAAPVAPPAQHPPRR